MNHKQKFLTAAGVLALSLSAVAAHAEDEHAAPAEKEKCYGIAAAGKNDCASADGSHSCAGAATVDNSPTEFVLVDAGKCAELGGAVEAPAAAE